MKILQLNLNHCEAAHDLLIQTARELQLDLIMISEPYKAVNKSRPFQEVTRGSGFVRVKIDNINSGIAP